MPLKHGSRLGPYELISLLGAGGMGEVYRARDHELERDVALKVLSRNLSSDAEAIARFEREARAIATLAHPNVVTLYGFGRDGGTAWAAMELLEGETLRDRLDEGPLSVRRAADVAAQVARGIGAAHARGIVHRDLKPENIFLTAPGTVKVLDFGLARRLTATSSSEPRPDAELLPGMVVGTPSYMAPEQVRGDDVDGRADIFALGCVLFEMLAGRRPFARETPIEVMTAILREAPPPLGLPPGTVSPALERIVRRCLEKQPADRYQSATDLAFHLESASLGGRLPESPADEPGGRVPSRRRRIVIGAGALVLAAVAASLPFLLRPQSRAGAPVARYVTFGGRDYAPALSPDGSILAFSRAEDDGRTRVFLKVLRTGDERSLTHGDDARFSPDGATVLFTGEAEDGSTNVSRIPVLGGDPRLVARNAFRGDFSPDGARVAFYRSRSEGAPRGERLVVGSAEGGAEREFLLPAPAITAPRFSRSGREVALGVRLAANRDVPALVELASGKVRTVPLDLKGAIGAVGWNGDGQLVVFQELGEAAAIRIAAPFRCSLVDLGSRKVQPLFAYPGRVWDLCLVPGGGGLVFDVDQSRTYILEMPLSGQGGPTRLSRGIATDRQPVFSPDGRRLVFASDRAGSFDLWSLDLASGDLRRLTEDPGDDYDPSFAPDGRRLYFSSNRLGLFGIYSAEPDGRDVRRLTPEGREAQNPVLSPDGASLYFNSWEAGRKGLWRSAADGAGASLVVADAWLPAVSADGRFLLYEKRTQGGLATVEVVRTADLSPTAFRCSAGTGSARAVWAPDGRAIYLVGREAGTTGVVRQDFDPDRDTAATRRLVTSFPHGVRPHALAISPDGRKLAIAAREFAASVLGVDSLPALAPAGAGR